MCTSRCAFCDVATGKPEEYDTQEPYRVAESVEELGLRYVTVTGVARDDLEGPGRRCLSVFRVDLEFKVIFCRLGRYRTTVDRDCPQTTGGDCFLFE